MIQDKIKLIGGLLGGIFLALLPFACGATPHAEVYYKAGTGLDDNWGVQPRTPGLNLFTETSDPPGASVSESGGAIVTSSPNGTNGMENSYQLHGWEASYGRCDEPLVEGQTRNCINNNMQRIFNFDIQSSGMFAVYVIVDTNAATVKRGHNAYARGARILKYTPEDVNTGGASLDWTCEERKYYTWRYNEWYKTNYGVDYPNFCSNMSSTDTWAGKTYHYGIGSDKRNGSWHTISRNIEDDIKNIDPNADISAIRSIVVQGNVRMNNVELDFDSDMWDKYEQFQIDPDWVYDTGWLDPHDDQDNPPGMVQCLPTSGNMEDCNPANFTFSNCSGVYKEKKADFVFDGSGLPSPIMNDCYLTMMSKYTYDGLIEGIQQHEIVVVVLENSAGTQTFIIEDPGEGPQKVTANEPITLVQGPNTFRFRTPGYCGAGESVHFGRNTRAVYEGHGIETVSQDSFRIKCGPGANALNLNIDANPNPLVQTGADTSLVTWDSQNAKRCVPSGGYFDGADNDWRGMAPAWSDVTLLPGYSVPTKSFSTTAYNAIVLPPTPLFTTNPIPYSVAYTLECFDDTSTTSILKSETVAVYGPGCWDDPSCDNFVWKRVNSRNDSGNDTQNNDPYCHPGWADNAGVCQGAPTNPNGYVLKDQDFDNGVVMDPIRVHYSAGNHDIVFKRREQGGTLDKILVTPVSGGITPSGKGGTGTVGNSVWMEAENAVIYGSELAQGKYEDYTASGYKAIEAELWVEDMTRSSSSYYTMKFNVNIPAAGDYYIWARVGTKTPSVGVNSFWVAPDWIDTNGDSTADDRYEYVLFDTTDHGECCHKFDFWAGTEADKGTPAGSNPPAINVGDSITLYWDSGNILSAMAEMNSAGDYDPSWPGFKLTENTPFLPTHIPPPPPNYNSQTITPLVAGTYKYQLTGIFNESLKTETKEVTIDVGPVAPPVVNAQCGNACETTHCEIPTQGLCMPPSTLAGGPPPAGITPKPDGSAWTWTCDGLNGGASHLCEARRQCGWVER